MKKINVRHKCDRCKVDINNHAQEYTNEGYYSNIGFTTEKYNIVITCTSAKRLCLNCIGQLVHNHLNPYL